MKKRLNLLKQQLLENENYEEKKIADSLGVEFSLFYLKKVHGYKGVNRYIMDNDMVFFYPVNDGMPTCAFEFIKDNKMIIHNQTVYSEITNLDEILLQMVRLVDKSLDEGIVLDPYCFMLKLNDEVKENYNGTATLVITEKAIMNKKLNERNFDKANKYFINRFLDHFIGWNFGVSVNRNKTLKNELEKLNQKVMDKGIREYAGMGIEVYGSEKAPLMGLQHYHLPTEKDKVLSIKRNIKK